MVTKRIWNVRLNVDAFNAAMASFDSDQERVSFLSGLHSGLNGGSKKDKCDSWVEGWTIANDCLSEAKAFSDKQREKALKRDYGNAAGMPRHNHGNAAGMPNDNLQSTIQESKNEQPGNQPVRDEMDILSPSTAPQVPPSDSTHWKMHEEQQPWAKAIKAARLPIGRDYWTPWKGLVDDYGLDAVLSTAKSAKPDKRWPADIEAALIASRGQVNPGDAINPARLHRMEL